MNLFKNQLFSLGQIVSTPAALEAIKEAGEYPETYLQRHVSGDWGDLEQDDKAMNNNAVTDKENPDRVFSAYAMGNGTKIWIITEWDRSATTILLLSDY